MGAPWCVMKTNRRGFTLILAYCFFASLLVLISSIVHRAISEISLAERNRLYTEAFYLAEGAVAQASVDLATRTANYQAIPANYTSAEDTATSSNVKFTYSWTDLSGGVDAVVTSPSGIVSYVRYYKLFATATPVMRGWFQTSAPVVVNQIICRRKTYTFQHAVFYADDLEMLPGRNMTLSGKIHSNHSIYLGAESGATFTIDTDYLYSASNIYNRRKDNANAMNGAVSIRKKGTATFELVKKATETDGLDCERADWTDESQVRWAGTVKSSVHGVTTLAVPQVGSISPTGFYAQQAGLKIVDTTAYDNAGNPVVLPAGTVTQGSFFDRRENKTITVTNIDMPKLNSSGYFPANGLLYVTRTDASTTTPNGIRLQNGETLQSALTVVSNDPVYVSGHYNNTSKKPAAIICDTLNLLSEGWSDTTPVDNRVATATTMNAAFISGIDTTTTGHYNGGLENYPRLLENWTNKTLTIRGSFVQLWNSQLPSGDWVYGMPYYTAPARDWNYDPDFNNSANLPPFTPFAVETQKVVWWKS